MYKANSAENYFFEKNNNKKTKQKQCMISHGNKNSRTEGGKNFFHQI